MSARTPLELWTEDVMPVYLHWLNSLEPDPKLRTEPYYLNADWLHSMPAFDMGHDKIHIFNVFDGDQNATVIVTTATDFSIDQKGIITEITEIREVVQQVIHLFDGYMNVVWDRTQ